MFQLFTRIYLKFCLEKKIHPFKAIIPLLITRHKLIISLELPPPRNFPKKSLFYCPTPNCTTKRCVCK